MNEALSKLGVRIVKPEIFVDYYTFNYFVNKDEWGNPIKEPGYNFEIRHFKDAVKRKWFWQEVKPLLKDGLCMDIKKLAQIAEFKRKNSISFQ